jgi:polysaccharide pyruvyl transferase WcaK-like protein
LDAERVRVINNGIELKPLDEDLVRGKWRRLGEGDPLRILFLSNLIESKGYPEYIEALELLSDYNGLPIEAKLCGKLVAKSFEQRFSSLRMVEDWIQNKIDTINLSKRIKVEWVRGAFGEEKARLFAASHVFILPSRYSVEAQPLVLIEAMASGCAIITTEVGEIKSMFERGQALLLPNATSPRIADAVEDLLGGQMNAREMAMSCWRRQADCFSYEVFAANWRKIGDALSKTNDTRPMRNTRILVHGHLGQGNFGDELMLTGLLKRLLQLDPEARIGIAYGRYGKATWYRNRKIYIVPRGLFAILYNMIGSDIYIVCGGTQFATFRRDHRHTLGVIRHMFLLVAARLLLCRTALVGVGLGPFETKIGGWLSSRCIRLSEFTSVRDSSSAAWLEMNRISRMRWTISDDLAFLVGIPKIVKDGPHLGLGLMPYFANYRRRYGLDIDIVRSIGPVIVAWRARHPKGIVTLFIFLDQPTGYSDRGLAESVQRLFPSDEAVELRSAVDGVESFIADLGSCTQFISMRYHSEVLAWRFNIPQICVAYHSKNLAFARDHEFPEGSVVTVEEMIQGKLLERACCLFDQPQMFCTVPDITETQSEDRLLPKEKWIELVCKC